jgi:hypothetical protein
MSPELIIESVAAAIWDNAAAVAAGVRAPWAEATTLPMWERRVRSTREQARVAVTASRNALAAQVLTEAAEDLEVAARGRSAEYVLANRHDCYVLRVRASEYLDGDR